MPPRVRAHGVEACTPHQHTPHTHHTHPHTPHTRTTPTHQKRSDDPAQAQRDREARARAAAQAEARQQKFEQSAVGRAALKSVQNAKKAEQRAPAGGASAGDWLS